MPKLPWMQPDLAIWDKTNIAACDKCHFSTAFSPPMQCNAMQCTEKAVPVSVDGGRSVVGAEEKIPSFTRVGRGWIFLSWVSEGGLWKPYDVTLRRPATRLLLTLAWLFLQPEGAVKGGDAGVGSLMQHFASLPASNTCLWQNLILVSKASK